MSITRSRLREMTEDELRTEVLIPLFRAMGFRDVKHFHGGSLEKGKDIVMWEADKFRERVNYGVVVKATKISGKVSGKSSATEVYMQVKQCLNSTYPDSVTLEEQYIHRCLVISSKEISKEAQDAIKDSLRESGSDKVTEFIDGDRLWGEYIEKYLPARVILEKLEQVDKILGKASPNYRINARTSSEGIELSLEPKTPESMEHEPLKMTVRLQLLNTTEGLQVKDSLEQHFVSGTPVTVDKPFIEDISVPEFMKPFLPDDGKPEKIVIGSRRSTRTLVVDIDVQCADGKKKSIESLPLNAIQVGLEEMTLTNESQILPLRLRLVLSAKRKIATFNIETDFSGSNVEQVLKILRFTTALAKGGIISIRDVNTRFELLRSPIISENLKNPDSRWVSLIEDLVLIQRKSRVPIYMPEHAITFEEFRAIKLLAHKFRTGRAKFVFKDITLTFSSESARHILDTAESGEPAPLRLEQDEIQEIFGSEIPFGRAIYKCDRVQIAPEERERLKAAILSIDPSETVTIRFLPVEDCPMIAEYPQWIADEDSEPTG